jgi:hypothetical protein
VLAWGNADGPDSWRAWRPYSAISSARNHSSRAAAMGSGAVAGVSLTWSWFEVSTRRSRAPRATVVRQLDGPAFTVGGDVYSLAWRPTSVVFEAVHDGAICSSAIGSPGQPRTPRVFSLLAAHEWGCSRVGAMVRAQRPRAGDLNLVP